MNSTLTRYEALQLAVDRMGNQDSLAAAIGVSQPTVSNWINRTKQLPAEYVLRVESLTDVSRHDLRPDIYPRPVMASDNPEHARFHGVDSRANRRAVA